MSSRPYLFATTASSSPRRASSGLAVRLWRSARPRRPTAPPSAVRISCSASQPNDPRVPAAELPGGVWWMSAPLGGGAAAGPLKNAASVRGFGEGFIILDSSGSSTTDTPPPTEVRLTTTPPRFCLPFSSCFASSVPCVSPGACVLRQRKLCC
jgi:hypothetical protein